MKLVLGNFLILYWRKLHNIMIFATRIFVFITNARTGWRKQQTYWGVVLTLHFSCAFWGIRSRLLFKASFKSLFIRSKSLIWRLRSRILSVCFRVMCEWSFSLVLLSDSNWLLRNKNTDHWIYAIPLKTHSYGLSAVSPKDGLNAIFHNIFYQ